MEIMQIVALGVVATIIIVVLKAQKPEIAVQISILTGIIIFMLVVGRLTAVIKLVNGYAAKVNIDMAYMTTLLKIIGIAYIAEINRVGG